MNNYSIYLATEKEKINLLQIARNYGATVAGVSGCGTGYYIQITATEEQAQKINNTLEV